MRRDGRLRRARAAPDRGDRRLARHGRAAAPDRARRPAGDASRRRSTSRRSAALVRDDPFTRRGEIAVVDAEGRTVLESRAARCSPTARSSPAPRRSSSRSARPEAIEGYVRPRRRRRCSAPTPSPTPSPGRSSPSSARTAPTRSSTTCCATCSLVGLAGFGVAAAAALFFAGRLTGPILKIGERRRPGRRRRPLGAGRGRAHPRRDRRPRRPDERDDPPAQRAAGADEVRLARDGDRDPRRRRRRRRPRRRAAQRRGALLRHPRLHRLLRGGRRPRWWSRC